MKRPWFSALAAALVVQLMTQRVATATTASIDSSESFPIGGVPVSCIDVRTGESFDFRAQRLLLSGARDTAWTPGENQQCLGSVGGLWVQRAPDGLGGAFVAWADDHSGEPDVYLQHFTEDGTVTAGWPGGGLAVSNARLSQYHVCLSSDQSGGVYVAWEDYRQGAAGDIYATRITGDAQTVSGWNPGGTPICTASGEQSLPSVAGDQSGVWIVWQDRRSGAMQLYAERLSPTGTVATGWTAGGDPVGGIAAPAVRPKVVTDGSGHAAVFWQHQGLSGWDLGAGALGSSGPTLEGSVEVSSSAAELADMSVISQGDHGLVVSWGEWRGGIPTIRAQRLDISAGIQTSWPTGGVAIHQGAIGYNAPVAVVDGAGGVVIAWEDYRSAQEGDIYARRILLDGSLDSNWPTAGLAVAATDDDQYTPTLARDGPSAVLAAWGDASIGATGGYLMTKLAEELHRPVLQSATATPGHVRIVWQAPSADLATFYVDRRIGDGDWQHLGVIVLGTANLVTLEDHSVAEGVHADYRLSYQDVNRVVFLAPVGLEVPIAPRVLTLISVIPRGARHEIGVTFSLPHGPQPMFDLIDVQGRRVASQRLTGLEPGDHTAAFDLSTNLSSGIYFLRLVQGNEQRVAKVVYVR